MQETIFLREELSFSDISSMIPKTLSRNEFDYSKVESEKSEPTR